MRTLLAALALIPGVSAQLAEGTSGMVSTAHPAATKAGIAILESGGNAFDAAIGIAATLNVVEPQNSGLGGYGLIEIYDAAKNRVRVLNASGRIPSGLDRSAFDLPSNRRGAKVIAPPVNARAWEELSRTYGNKPWKSLFDAAVRIAEEGFVLDSSIPERVFAEFPEHAKAVYGSGGKPLQKGATLVQRDLARSLRAVASKGAGELHGGELGRKVAAELARAGSFVTLDDISTSRPEWGEPISIDYRGYRVTTAPPAANSFAALIRLGIVSQWDMRKVGEDGTEYWHRWAEALKHGEYCRLRYAADPAFATVPLARLLTAEYWREQAARVDAVKASDFTPPGVGERESANTTHFAVADKRGNVVTMTQTIGNTFGSRIMAPGTGIWLNDSLFYSTWEPRGNPMDVHAGRRKLNSNTPTIVLKDGRPWIAIGAAGGHTIPQTVPLTVAQMIDLDKDIERALAAPRISFVAESKTLSVEPRLPESIRKDLASRGHDIRVAEIGRLHGLTIEWDADGRPRRFTGAADPRGQGLAKGPK